MIDVLKHLTLRTLAAFEPRPPIALAEIKNFVLLQHAAALGTAIHATPLVPALRAAVPDAKIVVAASGFALDLFRNNPGVDAVLPIPLPTQQPFAAARRLRRTLALEQPFATITTTGNERSMIALSAWLAGAGNRVGFSQAPALFQTTLTYDPALSQIANNLRIVQALGHPAAAHHEPQIFFQQVDLSYIRSLLASSYKPDRLLAVLVTQTSPTQRKSWRPERFVAAAQFLIDTCNADLVFVGTAAEAPAIEAIQHGLTGKTSNLAGKTSLPQLAALLSLADIGLTLDTGTLHLARAVGLPMVIIAPAWSPPVEWLPLGDPRFTILKNLDLPTAPADYVIDEVSVDDVTAALTDLLCRYPRRT